MIDKKLYDMPHGTDMAWCPGCGNFPILNIMKGVLAEMDILPTEVVICSGIGQAAKTPHYLRVHYFNGLHGRALPPAIAIKTTNPELTVIAESGDGDTYGEGGNHFRSHDPPQSRYHQYRPRQYDLRPYQGPGFPDI